MPRIIGFAGGAFVNVEQGGDDPPGITTTTLSPGYVDFPFSQTLAATGSVPITWAVTVGSLPAGLSLDANTGEISGTPTTEEEAEFTVEATNAHGSDTKAFTLQVHATVAAVAPERTIVVRLTGGSSSGDAIERKWRRAMTPGSVRRYEVTFAEELARKWETEDWLAGDVIRLDNGYDALCLEDGRSSEIEPAWPDVEGEQVQSGSSLWQIVAPTSDSLEATVDDFEWECEEEGITFGGAADIDSRTTRLVSIDDELAAGDYPIMVTANLDTGEVIKQPCILQVL